MHDRGDRERGRGFEARGSSARSPDRQLTHEEEAAQRVYRVSQEIDSASTRIVQLAAIVRRDEWRTERAKLQHTHDTLVENLQARELDAKASARARDHYDQATKKLNDIATALTNAQEPPRPVPPVAGEEAIEPSIVARNASPDDVLAWVAGLDARERSAIAERVKTVLGSVKRIDRFAVDLANYLAGSRILPHFYKVAENPRKHFNAAAYAKTRARTDADASSADDKTTSAPSTGPTHAPGPEGTTAGQPAARTLPVVSRDDSPDAVAGDGKQPDTSARKGGPLPYQQDMERSFDRSFAHVEAHTDMAAELQPFGAQAITVGHVMMFADARPSPPLVAHEATHAVQNQQAGMSAAMASGGVMSEHSPAEVEADAMADRVAQHGLGVRLPAITQTPTARIARSPGPRNAPPTPPVADRSPSADGDGDATALAERCRLQGHLIVDSYPEFTAGSKLAAMAARLAERAKHLPTMPAADYARLGQLFAQQSSVLYVVAGDLETLATQARKLQRATSSKAIDPRLAGIAELVLDAGACSDLPETARKQLELAHAKHAAIPFDAMDAMLDDARTRTMATDELAAQWGPGDSGSTKTSRPMTGRQQWEDLRAREDHLSGDVLAARRAHDAGTDKAGATRVLIERTRALQIEAHLVAAETHCGYMSDKLEEQQGVLATIAGQMRDLQRARHDLQTLANTMAGIRIRWHEKHAQLFALVDSGTSVDSDPATALRHAIAELETELAQVGDEEAKAALETAQSELKDMAIARAVADIAVMIGLTLATSGVGAAAAGAARGVGMGRTAAQLVNVATQSVAMATLRTMLYHDSFSSAFGSELLTNFAGLAALRGVAMGLSKLKLGKSLAILKQGESAWKYIAHGTELTIEAATQAGLQFAIAEADSLIRQGRTLNDDELKMLAIQGIGMFVGNAIAHRLANPVLDALGAYAARIGAPYRRAQVRKLAERIARTGDPEASKELIRAERELVAEELALLQRIARDPAERAQFGETTLATVTEQAHGHAAAVTELGVEHALQHGLDEISPGKAWEGSAEQVGHVLAEAHAQGARVQNEQLPDGTRRHTLTAGAKQYTVYEIPPESLRVRTRTAELTRAGLTSAQLKALTTEFTDAQLTALEAVMSHKQLAAFYASPDMGKGGLGVILDCTGNANIRGLNDWINFAARKDSSDWRRSLGELREAQRASKEFPSAIIDVGTDAHAPNRTGKYSAQGTPEKAESFDITVYDARGTAIRSIEVTSINKPVINTAHIAEGIKHATSKINSRNTTPVDAPGHPSGTPLPIPGERDIVIQIKFFHGEMNTETSALTPAKTAIGTFPPFAAGRKGVTFDGLGGYRSQDHIPHRPASVGPTEFLAKKYDSCDNPGNIIDNFHEKLNKDAFRNATPLSRIRLVGFDGHPIALFEQNGTGRWIRK